MKLSLRSTLLVTAIALTLPSAAFAQENVVDQANAVADTAQQLEQEANTLSNVAATETAETAREEDARDEDNRRDGDDDFPWGLLGLLGLAGLLGLKGRDRDDRIDRDYTRTTTADRTGTTTDRRL